MASSWGGGSVDLALAAFPIRGAELELLELAGGGAGQLGSELDRRRALEVGQVGAAVLDELGLGGLGACFEDDQGLDRLAPLLVGDADDADLGHGRMREHPVLDLDRRDVLAAADDDVLLAVGDSEVALVVEGPTVAGVEPAVDDGLAGLLRLLPVALEDDVS